MGREFKQIYLVPNTLICIYYSEVCLLLRREETKIKSINQPVSFTTSPVYQNKDKMAALFFIHVLLPAGVIISRFADHLPSLPVNFEIFRF